MSAHRYWRLAGLPAWGQSANLSLTEAQMLDAAGALLSGGVISCTTPPLSGTLTYLSDGGLSQSVTWALRDLAGVKIAWDFTAPVEVADIRLGGANPLEFPLSAALEFSDDALAWTRAKLYTGPIWPGAAALTSSNQNGNMWDRATLPAGCVIASNPDTCSPASQGTVRGGLYKSEGVHQFEITVVPTTTPSYGDVIYIGVGVSTASPSSAVLGSDTEAYAIFSNQPANFSGSRPNYANFVGNDVIGVVVDFSVGSVTFYKNGVSLGVATATGVLGKALSPRAGDAAGWTSRDVKCVLRLDALAFPIAGASDWSGPASISVAGSTAGSRSYGGTDALVVFPGAAAASGSLTPFNIGAIVQGDYSDPGKGRVRGTVKLKGSPSNTPLMRKVRLIRESDGMVIRQSWSNALTGDYLFEGLNTTYAYTVVSYDHTHDKRAVIADNLTLANGGVELMP